MDEDNFEKERELVDIDAPLDAAQANKIHDADGELALTSARSHSHTGPSFTNPMNRGEPSIAWVRASDLLYSGSGRIAGRGLDFETVLARRVRQSSAVTRRGIRDRADRLPPLSEFGAAGRNSSFTRSGPGLR
jgi:hypothetical protein